MKKKFESLKVLKSETVDALQKLQELDQKFTALQPQNINSATSEKDLIVAGYFLSGIYSVIEEIFVKVAKEFENKVEDPLRWHVELLSRMALEIEEVRPAIISKQSRDYLDELRRFRHVFRFSYAFELKWEKILLAVKHWQKGKKFIYRDLEKFVVQIDQLAA
jgi:hypothetical protein